MGGAGDAGRLATYPAEVSRLFGVAVSCLLALAPAFACRTRPVQTGAPSSKMDESSSIAAESTPPIVVASTPPDVKCSSSPETSAAGPVAGPEGRLDPAVIKRVIRVAFPRFRACYERALKQKSTLAGTVGVEFVIDRPGTVCNAVVLQNTTGDPALGDCVLAEYRRLVFPSPNDGRVKVSYPITFTSD